MSSKKKVKHNIQMTYVKTPLKLKEFNLEESLLSSHSSITDKQIMEVLEVPKIAVLKNKDKQNNTNNKHQQQVASANKPEEETLTQVHSDLIKLNELVGYIQGLVNVQGEKLDTVDDCIEQSVHQADSGLEELEKAEEYQRRSYVRKIKIVSGALIGGLMFGGMGASFGYVQGLVAGSVGSGSGALSGYLF